MGDVAARAIQFFVATVGLSAAAIMLLSRFAPHLGIVDPPGGRKLHDGPIPLVGGLAIFAALLAGSSFMGTAAHAAYFLTALSLIIAVGLWDDATDISPRVKLLIQVMASGVMIWGADIQLHGLGNLFGFRPVGLWVLAVPLTVFAVVGVVNAVNMMDGLDGLGGCIGFTAFVWYALVAIDSGLEVQFNTALIMCGAIAGFLLFNLRLPWQRQARVFLGDAGSLMMGFALGWFAIDLTQGQGRSFPPIAALWVLLLPLADCVSLMARRLAEGRSPFVADRRHIHHYLLARGFNPSQTLAILIGISVLFGAVGYFGWKLRVPEPFLFYPFFFGFFAYHFWMRSEWRRLARIAEGLPSTLPLADQSPASAS
jgi:UDP-GlcNAc:undecaprenyl-phosphate/decaprenyl-phosphate GlcNAc-1-phosphate transferase